MNNLSGREVFGGSAYAVPYEVWLSNDPERVIYEVTQSWDPEGGTHYMIFGDWVDSWEEVEERVTRARYA